MTVKEIADFAGIISGRPINVKYAARLINDCINTLAPLYSTINSVDEVLIQGNTGQLPDTTLSVVSVFKLSGGKQFKYTSYKIFNNVIEFGDSGDFKVIVKTLPKDVINADDEPSVHPAYQKIIHEYVAAMVMLYEDPNSVKGTLVHEQFFSKASNIHNELLNMTNKHRTMPSNIWR